MDWKSIIKVNAGWKRTNEKVLQKINAGWKSAQWKCYDSKNASKTGWKSAQDNWRKWIAKEFVSESIFTIQTKKSLKNSHFKEMKIE